MGYEPLYHAPPISQFFGHLDFYFSLVFYIFGTFIIKQLFDSCLLDTRSDYCQLGDMHLVGYLSSHIQRALVE